MTKPKLICALTSLSLIALTASMASAQPAERIRNPSVSYLMQSNGLSEAEAQMRIDLQDDVIAMSERLNTDNDPNYAGIQIQHEPVFKIIVRFADKSDRKDFLSQLDPKIRRFVQLKNVGKSKKSSDSELNEIAAAVASANIPFIGGLDLETDRYAFTVRDQAAVDRFRNLVPTQFKNQIDIAVGPVPGIQAAPTGVQAGDGLRGGQTVYDNTSARLSCTWSYAVSYLSGTTTKKGILTAGHCPETLYHKIGTRYVTLSGPVVERNTRQAAVGTSAGKYDYQIMDTTGLVTSYTIEYQDKNGIPEFPASGTLNVVRVTAFNNQVAGMVVCKSGAVTGVTCGKIVDGNALWKDPAALGTATTGWIKVSHTNQFDISAGGDSGAAWFLYPGTATDINAVGVHSAGDGVGPNSIAIYMPIDYIDDHITSVNTLKKP
jgi:hypothetical protein